MKYIVLIILCLQFNTSFANNRFILSTQPPNHGPIVPVYEGQPSKLWVSASIYLCANIVDTVVEYSDQTVNVLYQLGITPPCPSPIPPVYFDVADIRSLEAGSYTFNHYFVPSQDSFPPNPADYANYFIESSQFEIRGIISVDAYSQYSLGALITLILALSVFFLRKP